MSTDTARFIRIGEAHERLPHVFLSPTSARYCVAHREQLGMSDVFRKHLNKWVIDVDAAQRFVESKFDSESAA